MMTPMSEDGGPLREWSPFTSLLQQIPLKLQNGLFTQNLSFTCIDALPEFIAIGTNCGLVYWFNRETCDLQRLRCEDANSSITSLRVVSTVDYMVAAGNDHGVVTVFQIPKDIPESVPDSLKPKQKKQVERYNIGGLHKSPVTTVEWSKNGMKLFSGDHEGLVVSTEIDFYMHLSKSYEFLNEKYAIVQLSYQHGLLLVSTLYRTILVNNNNNSQVAQVGQKERKNLGKLGAVFGNRLGRVQEPVIYASRPGLRLWQADKNGTVQKTLIFKEALQTINTEVLLLNPAPEALKKKRGEPTFGILIPFCEDLFVTFSEEVIYIINPVTIAIQSVVNDLRKVTDVACTKDEIFVLEGQRNIIRIAYHPEISPVETIDDTKDFMALAGEMSKPVTSSLLGFTSKIKENAIVTNIPFYKISPSNIIQAMNIMPSSGGLDPNSVVHAEEATEMPPVVPLSIDTPLVAGINIETDVGYVEEDERKIDRRQIFQKISEQEFEEVVFTPERRNKKIAKVLNDQIEDSSRSDNTSSKLCSDIQETHSSLLTLSIDDDCIFKGERNLETIQRDVENKEKLLADVLNFDLSEYMTSSQTISESSGNSLNTMTYVSCAVPIIEPTHLTTGDNGVENYVEESEHTEDESVDENESYMTELKKLKDLGESSEKMLQMERNNSLSEIDEKPKNKGNKVAPRELELRFNVMSKEFVTSTIVDEADDWVVIP